MASNSASYPLSRGYKASARLNLQHFIHAKDVGYILHPSIPSASENLNIADLGTGTGVWLTDLHSQLPSSTVLDGFDISGSQFPPKEWLPQNVRLNMLDVFGEIPGSLHGKYDIINIRYFSCVIKDNDPGCVIRNALKMLKPGGHLQWSEQDYSSQKVIGASPSIPLEPFTALKVELERQSKSEKERFRWISELDQSFLENDMIDVQAISHAEQPHHYSLWQHTYMMVLEEMSYSVSDGNTVRDLLQKTQVQTPEGVFWFRGHLTFIGRKSGAVV